MTDWDVQVDKEATNIFRRLVTNGGTYISSQPRLRYWKNANGDRYFYTVEKISHKGNPRYVAGVYRHLKTKKQMKLVRQVGFAKRYKAKDWAYQAYQKNI